MTNKPKRERGTDPSKPRNVTIDAETQSALAAFQDGLEAKLGFRPTLSQTVRHLISEASS